MSAGQNKSKSEHPGIEGYDRKPIGRFAPSPTGELHFGSLVAAVGSFLQAKARGGRWLVRIEDIDPPREVTGAAERQLHTLARFGLVPDAPVRFQSSHRPRHDAALANLLRATQAFPCSCSRSDLPTNGVYPGTCRTGLAPGRKARSIRLRVGPETVVFDDLVFGKQSQIPAQQTGDFVIRRADGLIAYQLAVVVDDAADGITEVVRGRDLLESTGRQILLQRALGLPVPAYMHLPLVVDRNGRKLSKSQADDPVAHLSPEKALSLALQALGHFPPVECSDIDQLWSWALRHWSPARIPRSSVIVQEGRLEGYTP